MSYSHEIKQTALKCQIDGALIASVANVESGFKSESLSNKGAVGIMQLMPETAKWIADKNHIEYDENELMNAEYNIMLGGYYLSYLLNYFGDVQLGICAYNAGLGNVNKWLNNKECSEDGKTLIKIPFKETREYLSKVNKNYYYYKNRYK